jgi:hypothetical protein
MQFYKSTPKKPFEEASAAVFGRLKRASAAEPYTGEGANVGTDVEALKVDDSMTKAQLIAFAEEHKVDVDPTATKAVIIDTINAALTKAA